MLNQLNNKKPDNIHYTKSSTYSLPIFDFHSRKRVSKQELQKKVAENQFIRI